MNNSSENRAMENLNKSFEDLQTARELVKEAKQQVRENAKKVIKLKAAAKIKSSKSFLKGVSNKVVGAVEAVNQAIVEAKNKVVEKAVNTKNDTVDFAKDTKEKAKDRVLKLKGNVTKKIDSVKDRIRTVKTSILKKIGPDVIEAKVRTAATRASGFGIGVLGAISGLREDIFNFTTNQLDSLRRYRDEQKRKLQNSKNLTEAKILKFKDDMIQKINSTKGKFRNVGNAVLHTVSPSNIDLKFRNAMLNAGNIGLDVLGKGFERLNGMKASVTEFTSEQLERLRILKELAKAKKDVAKERAINIKSGVISKAQSAKSKAGVVKNATLKTVRLSNIDKKIEAVFTKAGVLGLTALNKGADKLIDAKDKVTGFTSKQIDSVRNWRKEQKRKIEVSKRVARMRTYKAKKNAVSKITKVKSKFGKVKTSVLKTLDPHKIDGKISGVFDKVSEKGAEIKQNAANFTGKEIRKVSKWRNEQKAKKAEERAQLSENIQKQREQRERLKADLKKKKDILLGISKEQLSNNQMQMDSGSKGKTR